LQLNPFANKQFSFFVLYFLLSSNNKNQYEETMMNKIILSVVAVSAFSLNLMGCQPFNAVGRAGNTVVGTGVGLVSTTGATVGRAVGAGVDILVGRPATRNDMVAYRKNGVVYHNGHAYRIQNGRYVRAR
jgi:hypothetical protein